MRFQEWTLVTLGPQYQTPVQLYNSRSILAFLRIKHFSVDKEIASRIPESYPHWKVIGSWISSRCFFKDGSSSTPCMKFRMVTHMQGSTVSNLKFQRVTVHFSVNKVIFYYIWKYLLSCEIKCICGEFYCTTLFKTNLQLKHLEFLLRLMMTMLCRIWHAETGFVASKIMILNLRIKDVLVHRQNLKTKNERKYSMKADLRC